MKIVHPDHFEIVGRGPVLLASPPRPLASSESYTGKIVEEIALLSKAHAIIEKEAKMSDSASGSQGATPEFDTALKRLCDDNGIKCILIIEGKKEPGIEIKTPMADSTAKEIVELAQEGFAVEFDVKIDPKKKASEQDISSRSSAPVITLALGPDERIYRKDAIIAILADTIGLINSKLGYSEGTSDVLD